MSKKIVAKIQTLNSFLITVPVGQGVSVDDAIAKALAQTKSVFGRILVGVSFYESSDPVVKGLPAFTSEMKFRKGCRFRRGVRHENEFIERFENSESTKLIRHVYACEQDVPTFKASGDGPSRMPTSSELLSAAREP